MQKFDTIIIGGGPGGTPAAIQLASKGKKVLLVEIIGQAWWCMSVRWLYSVKNYKTFCG